MLARLTVLAFVALLSTVSLASQTAYPIAPDENLTPGALCQRASELRYAEKIKYCERDVSGGTKAGIFQKYDQLGYRTRTINRQKFKIDHYIPLCMGGSNETKNLWPQHETVYTVTDQLEALLCEKMKAGRLRQKKAVEYVVKAKNDLADVPAIVQEVEAL